MRTLRPDLCVIGAGSGGLSVAAGAAMLGRKVVLIEKGEMGGDCLNYGCVPSKALLAAGARAQAMRDAGPFGIAPVEPQIDARAVRDHVRSVIAAIAPTDSQQRFEGLGVTVIRAAARFRDRRTVEAEGTRIRARRFVIATGSSPAVPPIPGLGDAPYFTNETIFEKDFIPPHLIVIGAGPIGLEMAQAHRRLGSEVTVLEALRALPRDDPELVAILVAALRREGVVLHEGTSVKAIEKTELGIRVHAEAEGQAGIVEGTHLLIAAGRRPNIAELNLDAAGIAHGPRGIAVDRGLRTTNRRAYAVGDVAGGPQFTHAAGYHAGLVIRNALFRLPVRADYAALPWASYTDPELAHVGLGEDEARAKHKTIRVLRWPLAENDRARTMRTTAGAIKLVVAANGRVLGATIVAPHAGELILSWAVAIGARLGLSAMAGAIAPYPTLSELSKRAAGTFYTPTLFSARARALVRFLSLFG